MRVFLYSDQPVLADGLKAVLAEYPDIAFAGWSNSMPALLTRPDAPEVDLLILDLTSEVTYAALTALRRTMAQTKVVLWVRAIPTELAYQAMGMGVRGIIRKTLPTSALVDTLRRVEQGETCFEGDMLERFLALKRVALTQREGQLVHLVAQGLKNKEIAQALEISEGTTKTYLSKIYDKTGVKDRYELALYAARNLTAHAGDVPTNGNFHYDVPPSLRLLATPKPPEAA